MWSLWRPRQWWELLSCLWRRLSETAILSSLWGRSGAGSVPSTRRTGRLSSRGVRSAPGEAATWSATDLSRLFFIPATLLLVFIVVAVAEGDLLTLFLAFAAAVVPTVFYAAVVLSLDRYEK